MAPRELNSSVGVLVRDAVLFRTVLCFCGPVTCQALAQTSVALRVIVRTQCDPVWRFFAKQRWGSGVEAEEARDAATTAVAPKTPDEAVITAQSNWFSFYQRRVSTWKAPVSPLDLTQEHYAGDPWRLLVTCIMCSRTSGGPTIRETLAQFLARYPTPTAVIRGDEEEMAALLHPLGLHRERTVRRCAAGFLRAGWSQPIQLYGIGKFANDSWRVFCHGEYAAVAADKLADRNVRAYAAYCKRIFHRDGGEAGSAVGPTVKARRKAPAPSARALRAKKRRRSAATAPKRGSDTGKRLRRTSPRDRRAATQRGRRSKDGGGKAISSAGTRRSVRVQARQLCT